jgi:hypothetical protein
MSSGPPPEDVAAGYARDAAELREWLGMLGLDWLTCPEKETP